MMLIIEILPDLPLPNPESFRDSSAKRARGDFSRNMRLP